MFFLIKYTGKDLLTLIGLLPYEIMLIGCIIKPQLMGDFRQEGDKDEQVRTAHTDRRPNRAGRGITTRQGTDLVGSLYDERWDPVCPGDLSPVSEKGQ
jgi:hypothetical protein